MKKLTSLIVILCCCTIVFAQQNNSNNNNNNNKNNNDHKKIFVGLSFGPTIDWFAPKLTDIEREKAKAGFITGVNIDINVTKPKFLYFSTGILIRYLQGGLDFNHEYHFAEPIDASLELPTTRIYQTTYLTLPTGIKLRTKLLKGCVISGKIGLYHNFKLGEAQFDNFKLPSDYLDSQYFVSTAKKKDNNHAALFAESAYVGVGFEYAFKQGIRVLANIDYSCQFNYFNPNAKSNVSNAQFKSLVHSLHIVVGVLF